MPNRLEGETSPYLLQHRDNPVAWWPWGPEALAVARESGKPILLSIGYAACHWCHVMAHESFEDPDIATLMNELFVNIKVDREERPDVDHHFMSALHALGEQGGWPLTMFLTSAGEPFWGGTYFPPTARYGRPGFPTILRQVAEIYAAEPQRIEHNRAALAKALARDVVAAPGAVPLPADLAGIARHLLSVLDPVNGGFRGAPKFPQPGIGAFLHRMAAMTDEHVFGEAAHLAMERICRGGIHDHAGGGFARYAVDEVWLVPHFEKMLYDNAQLLERLAALATDLPSSHPRHALYADAARRLCGWLLREMRLPHDGFASSLDADSEGEEGLFYLWTRSELDTLLGDSAATFAAAFDVTPGGNFENRSILNRLHGDLPGAVLAMERHAEGLERLLDARSSRVRPGLDDKVLADWNGLVITGLVRAGTVFDRPDWIEAAAAAFRFVSESMSPDGRLGHSSRAGTLVHPGFALDHAAMARGALALWEATGTDSYRVRATQWLDVLLDQYLDPDLGHLAMTTPDRTELTARPAPTHDDAVPNANAVFVETAIRLGAMTGNGAWTRIADDVLARLAGAFRQPLAHAALLDAAAFRQRRADVVVIADRDHPLSHAAIRLPFGHRTCLVVPSADALPPGHAASAGASGLRDVALVCAEGRCSLPLTDVAALEREVGRALLA